MGSNAKHRLLGSVLIAAFLGIVACNRNQGPDPAAANLAPADQNLAQAAASEYGQQLVEAPQPPPPLVEYTQPECPGENYMWTPGYWSYSDAGYYWVPGAWVMAPYVDALWTPPYWDYYGGRYRWHGGYWSRHVGFYGGINYGFGYTGLGFYGGYWDQGGQFVYNRSVTRINTRVVNTYYNHSVENYTPVNRVSYNGGPGGIVRQPVAAELAVRRENRMNAMPVQMDHMRTAAADRSQFASMNRGRPSTAAAERPLPAPYAAPAPRGEFQNGEARGRSPVETGRPAEAPFNREPLNRAQPEMPRGERGGMRGAPQPPQQMAHPQMPEPRQGNQGFREMPQQRQEQRVPEQARPAQPEVRGGAERRMPENQAPQRAPQPPAEARPQPQPHAEPAPQNQAHPAPHQPQQNQNKEDHGRGRGGN
jgi:hypothetical protein